jgi:hypothetical protein
MQIGQMVHILTCEFVSIVHMLCSEHILCQTLLSRGVMSANVWDGHKNCRSHNKVQNVWDGHMRIYAECNSQEL